MKRRLLSLISNLLLLAAPLAHAAQTETINFDGLSSQPMFPLTNQIPGVFFDGVQVLTPATIGDSPGIPLSAATSGQSAAFSSGARIFFSNPVVKVQTTVSPSFITVGFAMEPGWLTLLLTAYKHDGTVLTRSQGQIIYAAARYEDLTNFTPTTLSLSSPTPMAYITLSWTDPFNYGGATFFFDDLMLTIGENVPAVHPTISIRPLGDGLLSLNWGYPNCILQWTTNLATGPWQSIDKTTNALGGVVSITDPPEARSKFYRVLRLLPP